eukprot:352926-Chlamydomonas_euryale.AAC.2
MQNRACFKNRAKPPSKLQSGGQPDTAAAPQDATKPISNNINRFLRKFLPPLILHITLERQLTKPPSLGPPRARLPGPGSLAPWPWRHAAVAHHARQDLLGSAQEACCLYLCTRRPHAASTHAPTACTPPPLTHPPPARCLHPRTRRLHAASTHAPAACTPPPLTRPPPARRLHSRTHRLHAACTHAPTACTPPPLTHPPPARRLHPRTHCLHRGGNDTQRVAEVDRVASAGKAELVRRLRGSAHVGDADAEGKVRAAHRGKGSTEMAPLDEGARSHAATDYARWAKADTAYLIE